MPITIRNVYDNAVSFENYLKAIKKQDEVSERKKRQFYLS